VRASPAVEPEGGTKFRILETATRLFAEHGLDGVALRDIAIDAGVNNAAINYHFRSKELLIREVYRRLFAVLNQHRSRALDDCEVAARGKTLKPQDVVRALIEPMVRFSTSAESGGIYLVRLLFHAYGLSRDFVDQSIIEQVDHIALRFVNAMEKAIPNSSRADLFWRFDFAIGACQHILIDTQRGHRLKRLSDGMCDTDDNDEIIEQLVASITASFTAQATSGRSARKKTDRKH
jgi:AcrR family transcriptional regulator